MNFAVDNIWAFLAVGVLVAGHITITFMGAVSSKRALREAKAANEAVNGNPKGDPRAYDLLVANGIELKEMRGEIVNLASDMQRMNNEFNTHLSWHHQVEQSKPRSAPQSSGRTRKTVAKKAPVKKVASKT